MRKTKNKGEKKPFPILYIVMLWGAGSQGHRQEPAHVGPTTQAGLGEVAQSSLAHSLATDPLSRGHLGTAPVLRAAICSFYWCNWPGPARSLILGAFSTNSNHG